MTCSKIGIECSDNRRERLLEPTDETDLGSDRHADDPTPQEIRVACLRIQATWTEEERRYRAGLRDGLWLGVGDAQA